MPPVTVSVRLPMALYATISRTHLKTGRSIARLAKDEIAIRLNQGIPGGLFPEVPAAFSGGTVIKLALNDEEQDKVERLRQHVKRESYSDGQILTGLLLANYNPIALQTSEGKKPSLLSRVNKLLRSDHRIHQLRAYEAIRDRLFAGGDDRRVLLLEAATGTGKTRAMIVAAIERLNSDPALFGAIACPTYRVMQQFAEELSRIQRKMDCPSAAMIYGRREFVDVGELRSRLADDPSAPGADVALEWLDGGGLTHKQEGVTLQRNWLIEDLRAHTGDAFEIDDGLRLSAVTTGDDEGAIAYTSQFERGQRPRLTILTHAMLARETLTRIIEASQAYAKEHGTDALGKVARGSYSTFKEKLDHWKSLPRNERSGDGAPELEIGRALNDARDEYVLEKARLPELDFILIDEAHQIEENFSNALSHTISVWAIVDAAHKLRAVAPSIIKASALDRLQIIFDQLCATPIQGDGGRGMQPIHRDRPEGKSIVEMLEILDACLPSKKAKQPASKNVEAQNLIRKLNDARFVLRLCIPESKAGHSAYIRQSPRRRYPQIQCGRPTVEVELDYMFRKMCGQCVLASATLYLDGAGRPEEYIRSIIGLKSSDIQTMAPLYPEWITHPVTLYLPRARKRADGSQYLRPPTTADVKRHGLDYHESSEQQWLDEVAAVLTKVVGSASGGTLALMTAYSHIDEISKRLPAKLSDRMVYMSRGKSLTKSVGEFRAKSAARLKPCLLALGAAWTGLDLSGADEVADDNLLTDLVIPRVPFGANSTLTHEFRMRWRSEYQEAYAAAMLLKQGIGRLVRREGIPSNRRLYILDGRFNDVTYGGFMAPARQVLSKYNSRDFI